jgi:hypothetical protein
MMLRGAAVCAVAVLLPVLLGQAGRYGSLLLLEGW